MVILASTTLPIPLKKIPQIATISDNQKIKIINVFTPGVQGVSQTNHILKHMVGDPYTEIKPPDSPFVPSIRIQGSVYHNKIGYLFTGS